MKSKRTTIIASKSQLFEISNEPIEHLLLRHVNHRITVYLKSAYPEVKWEWCEKSPSQIIINGSTGRIRVYGIPEFNYADVKVDNQANISCSMINMIPLEHLQNTDSNTDSLPNKPIIDPQIWYEVQGRKVLESLIADLHSRGHSSLTVFENGDICIRQDDKNEAQDTFPSFPEKIYWPRLAKVLEQEGLAAQVQETGITITW